MFRVLYIQPFIHCVTAGVKGRVKNERVAQSQQSPDHRAIHTHPHTYCLFGQCSVKNKAKPGELVLLLHNLVKKNP